MTTDRKDGQSENYGFTLVINTPPPVYDSGSKPLEVVGDGKIGRHYQLGPKDLRFYLPEAEERDGKATGMEKEIS